MQSITQILFICRWHEAATYNAEKKSGGPDGSIRYGLAYSHPINDGLKNAINICGKWLLLQLKYALDVYDC